MKLFKRWKIRSLRKKVTVLTKTRVRNAVSDQELKKEIALLYELADLYEKLKRHKKVPHAEDLSLESLRAAANIDDVNAKCIVAERLIEKGKFWVSLQNTFFNCNAHEKYARDLFTEAFAYLTAAEAQGNIQAKRLHGLVLMNGWGMDKDEEAGLQLICDSIDQEDAWDKSTEIFKKLGVKEKQYVKRAMKS